MAVLWDKSRTYERDDSGRGIAEAKAYFFDAGTTTPLLVYTDPAYSIPHDHPVPASAFGKWPAVYLPEGETYRVRITDGDGGTISDDDGISVPTTTPPEIPDSDTPVEKLFQTGDLKPAWRSSAPNGWVRCNGRTVGAAASGATERANSDCQALFIFLWNNDANLSVSGGRGGTANGDWSANKQISLPDLRGRVPVGPDSFGNSAAGVLTDAILGADSDLLGAKGGSQTHTLTEAQIPAHGHSVTITDPGHFHSHNLGYTTRGSTGDGGGFANFQTHSQAGNVGSKTTGITAAANNTGGGEAHPSVQPSIVVPVFIKL